VLLRRTAILRKSPAMKQAYSDDDPEALQLVDRSPRDPKKWLPHKALRFLHNETYMELSLLLMRVITSLLIVHHGQDKLQHTEAFATGIVAVYFPFMYPPELFTYLAAGVEIVGSFCLAVGLFARPAAILLAGTMLNALYFHLMKFGSQSFPMNPEKGGAYTFEPCLAFLGVTTYLAFAGPGRFSVRPHGF